MIQGKRPRRMITCLGIVLGLGALLGVPRAQAHPPVRVTLRYDAEKQVLSIDVLHPARHRHRHYIRRYEIRVNGESRKTVTRKFQKAPARFVEQVPLEAVEGDEIRVEAFCSQGGSKEARLVVGAPSETTERP